MAKDKATSNRQFQGPVLHTALRLMQSGMLAQARSECERVVRAFPANADAHYLMGVIATRSNRYQDAAKHIAESLRLNPANPAGHSNLGVIFKREGRLEEAIACFQRAIGQNPGYVEAHHNLGNALHEGGRAHEALASFDRALALRADFAASHNSRGNVLATLERHEEALLGFDRAIAVQPGYAEAFSNKSNSLLALHRPEESLACADQSIALNPDSAKAHNNRGNALAHLRRHGEALESFRLAIHADPKDARAHANCAGVLLETMRFEEAAQHCATALTLDPVLLEAHDTAAQAATGRKRHGEAATHYARLFDLAPDYPFVKGNLLHARMLCCDWTGFDGLRAAIAADLRQGRPAAEPFGYQGVADSEADLLSCAQIYCGHDFVPRPPMAMPAAAAGDGRIVVGYLCGEFRSHATTILMCGVYELHDRSRFRLVAFDNGGDDGSDYRRRVVAAFDEVVEIASLGDAEAAAAIQARGVDVLVNLNGYYGEGRNGVFALRPSPVQVNYLGFPGTLGTPCMDYLIADSTVIPATSREFYVERIVSLPDCYQPNDRSREIAPAGITRAECGLPDDAFVFCNFNNNYKLTPQVFDGWMRILAQLPASVLWLLQDNHEAADNLRRSAQERGIAGDRLVFAPRLPPKEHLARHALADLFLDTLPYNAHTTASDALWAGLPLLTRVGGTFPGRVAASMLRAVGLPELVTGSEQEYEALALSLARDPPRLSALRATLMENRLHAPLFDTAKTTRHLEAAYEEMVKRQRSGAAPGHFDIGG